MGRHVAEVRLRPVVVLDQMVPEVPFPDDLAGGLAGRLHLHEVIGMQARIAYQISPAAGGDGLLGCLFFPHDHEHVAVGKPGYVVVRQAFLARKRVVPDEHLHPR